MLALMTMVWNRPRTTRIVLGHNATLRGIVPVAVVSPEDPNFEENRTSCDRQGWRIATSPNLPLGSKANAGLMACRDLPVAGVMVAGSDDLIPQALVDCALQELEAGAEYLTGNQVSVLDVPSWYCLQLRNVSTGVGRVLSRALLDRLDWKCWPPDINRGLDREQSARLMDHGASLREYPPAVGAAVLDIKSGEGNIWDFEELWTWNGPKSLVDADALLETHYPAVGALLARPSLQKRLVRRAKLGGRALRVGGTRHLADFEERFRRHARRILRWPE